MHTSKASETFTQNKWATEKCKSQFQRCDKRWDNHQLAQNQMDVSRQINFIATSTTWIALFDFNLMCTRFLSYMMMNFFWWVRARERRVCVYLFAWFGISPSFSVLNCIWRMQKWAQKQKYALQKCVKYAVVFFSSSSAHFELSKLQIEH